jgi:glycine/D-amino acid oxidase-like deaminating enzyme/nitrite reductase/ring-hydroxylating ferredoxin subunit
MMKGTRGDIAMKTAYPLQTHKAFWVASTMQSSYPTLSQDIEVDVAIVGAGLAGITAAMLLKNAGKRVAVLEAESVGQGTSGHTTAKITSLHQLKYATLIKEIGKDKARLYGESNQAAIEQIAALVRDEQIDCDFARKDAYTFAETTENLESVKQEADAAKALGLPATFVADVPLPFKTLGAVKFSQQAQFHPRKYLLALAAKIHGDGSSVFEQTRVETVDEETPCQVRTQNGYTVTARDVLVTTHLPILDKGLFFAKTYPKQSYLIGAKIDPAKAPDAMFIGTGEKYRSIRATPTDDGGMLLLIGGEGHKTGQASDIEQRYERLADYAQTRFGVNTIDYYWTSHDMVSFDKVPYVGKLTPASPHVLVATGFSLWGMSNSTVAAMLMRDMVLGQETPWASLYDATRPTPFLTQEMIKSSLDVGAHWVGDRLKGLFDNAEQIGPNEGKLVTSGTDKIAAYRDDTGTLHQVSAVCPHLGCIVAWNSAEKSWDCPCHGSRFGIDGEILHGGPAVKPLEAKG